MLVIGIDGADWGAIDAIAAEAQGLPSLSALQRSGARGSLRTLHPTLSPAIWTTVATGKPPEQHGITGFSSRQVMMAAGGSAPAAAPAPAPAVPPAASSNQRRVKAVWNVATDRGISSAVLGWWVTWPAEPIAGLMVSDRIDLARLDGRVHPASELARLSSLAVPGPPDVVPGPGAPEVERSLVARWTASDRRFARLGSEALADPRQRLVMVYLRGLDPICHRFWKHWRPDGYGVAPEDVAAMGRVVPDYYRFVDALVGDLVAARGDRAVVVLSDHGMSGILGTPALLDVRRLLERLDLAEGVGVSGDFLSEESSVVLSPATDALAERLAALEVGRETGPERLFRSVARVPAGLALSVNRGLGPRDRVKLPAGEVALADLTSPPAPGVHSGVHDGAPPGILLASGAGIGPGARWDDVSVYDVAPLMLALLGLPLADDMPGQVPGGVGKAPAPARIATYESGEARGGEAIATEYDEQTREELKALGYVR